MNKEKEHSYNSPSEFYNSKETIDGDIATINLGPTHPATHGIFQNILKVDGEKIISSEQTVGYIHRAFEKLAERRPYNQITTITDRLNYCSSPINNIGWCLTMEKLAGITVPKRVDYMRVIIMELARINDHLICNSVIWIKSEGIFFIIPIIF
jgi:NADH-quinone oxidoreductase subunit D